MFFQCNATCQDLSVKDVDGAREEVLKIIQRMNPNNNDIYFHGWRGTGVTAVLRSIAQAVPSIKAPPELCFGRTIYIDCSRWTSNRGMQRRIAQELRLDHKTMAMFEEQDEEDDFDGVDHTSRGAIRSVSAVIERTLRESRFMMIIVNGSGDTIPLYRFGIPEYNDCIILWTYGPNIPRGGPRYSGLFLNCIWSALGNQECMMALFREETAASIVAHYPCMRDIDPAIVVDCLLYGFLLYRTFGPSTTNGLFWLAQAPNYWICDGITQGNRAWEIGNALLPELDFERDPYQLDYMFRYYGLKKLPYFSFLLVTEDDGVVYGKRPYRWISITLKDGNNVHEDMQTMLAGASSVFLAFQTEKDRPPGLPNGLLTHCINLRVLVLSCCAFRFVSPPFIHCHTLRFLGLDRCVNDDEKAGGELIEGEDYYSRTKWECLQTLWAIDLYYTDWVDMLLSEENIELMASLMELNIEGARWSHLLTSRLQKLLPHLQRLRVIKPMYDEAAAASSNSMSNSLVMDKTNLELLDLSGNNRGMGNLSASISKASYLQVLILDGCDELEDVEFCNSSLRSFSLDGYGPASAYRTSTVDHQLPPKRSRPEHPRYEADNNKDIKTPRKISLEGCRRLENLFLRGLHNLVELDLSGCAIKVLDFETMVMDVPRLKRLFLLGCERLRAIRWGSSDSLLELLCIDTRPVGRVLGCAAAARPRPSLGTLPRSFRLEVHVISADARLTRSLPKMDRFLSLMEDVCFSISITSSSPCSGVFVEPEATPRKMMKSATDQQCRQHLHVAAAGLTDPMETFPEPPTRQLNHHVEIGDGSHAMQSEVESRYSYLASLMEYQTQSLHVHDVRNCSNTMPTGSFNEWRSLIWCRMERCPNLRAVFPPGAEEGGNLEILWVSDLLMARCIWSKASIKWFSGGNRFRSLQHLHLRCCPSLQFALAMHIRPSFPCLETLHVIRCGDLRHVFVPGDEQIKHTSIQFPKLTTIHLHDLPALQRICEAAEMLAPALETIRIRGCWSLRRLPALKDHRELGMKKPRVEVEKDVWDALEWDGVDAGHHPSLYQAPVHSRYYKRRLLRRTVLR